MIEPIGTNMITANADPLLKVESNRSPAHSMPKQNRLASEVSEPVKVAISPDTKSSITQLTGEFLPSSQVKNNEKPTSSDGKSSKNDAKKKKRPGELSESEKEQVQELKKRDAEVRTHEQQHAATGGQYAGGAVYEYQSGPDGKAYAIGGHVSIDTGSVPDDPQATIRKAQTVRAAALAPANPSGADRAIAAKASAMASQAQAELLEKSQEKDDDEGEDSLRVSQSGGIQKAKNPYQLSGRRAGALNSFTNSKSSDPLKPGDSEETLQTRILRKNGLQNAYQAYEDSAVSGLLLNLKV